MFNINKKMKINRKLSMRRNSRGNTSSNNANVGFNQQNQNIFNDNKKIKEGDTGKDVEELQDILTDLIHVYPTLPIVTRNGIYGSETVNAVSHFQKLLNLEQTGEVDSITFNKLRLIHSKRQSLEDINYSGPDEAFNLSQNVIKEGNKGRYVMRLQQYLNKVANDYPTITKINIDGIFGPETKKAVIEFQNIFNLTADGIVGDVTWNKLYNEYLK